MHSWSLSLSLARETRKVPMYLSEVHGTTAFATPPGVVLARYRLRSGALQKASLSVDGHSNRSLALLFVDIGAYSWTDGEGQIGSRLACPERILVCHCRCWLLSLRSLSSLAATTVRPANKATAWYIPLDSTMYICN